MFPHSYLSLSKSVSIKTSGLDICHVNISSSYFNLGLNYHGRGNRSYDTVYAGLEAIFGNARPCWLVIAVVMCRVKAPCDMGYNEILNLVL